MDARLARINMRGRSNTDRAVGGCNEAVCGIERYGYGREIATKLWTRGVRVGTGAPPPANHLSHHHGPSQVYYFLSSTSSR